jgi:hypothetical protein
MDVHDVQKAVKFITDKEVGSTWVHNFVARHIRKTGFSLEI